MNLFYKISDLKDVDIIISNVSAPGEWSQYLKENDVSWMIADWYPAGPAHLYGIGGLNIDSTALTDSTANQRMQLEAELQNQPSKPRQSSMIQRPDAAEKTI